MPRLLQSHIIQRNYLKIQHRGYFSLFVRHPVLPSYHMARKFYKKFLFNWAFLFPCGVHQKPEQVGTNGYNVITFSKNCETRVDSSALSGMKLSTVKYSWVSEEDSSWGANASEQSPPQLGRRFGNGRGEQESGAHRQQPELRMGDCSQPLEFTACKTAKPFGPVCCSL